MKSHLKLLALKYLSEEELSGTQITKKINSSTGWKPSPGTLYPAMEKLEEKGYVSTRKEGRKKIYSITSKGTEELESFRQEQEKHWGQVIQSLKNYSEMFDEEELEDLINHLEKVKDFDFSFPYPIIVSYRVMDLLANYNGLDQEEKQQLNKIMDKTHEKVEDVVKA